MSTELERLAVRLEQIGTPEALFGAAAGDREATRRRVKATYYRLAQLAHPDHYAGKPERSIAEAAIKRLNRLYELAERQLAAGTYGDPGAAADAPAGDRRAVLRTRKRDYFVTGLLAQGDLCNLYRCTYDLDGKPVAAILKIARDPADNDLVANETRVLRHLSASPSFDTYRPYIPALVEAFRYQHNTGAMFRQANVLRFVDGLYSLAEVARAYSDGVNPRDVAWIWRRLLVALGFLHRSGVIHGAILPPHVLIQPEQHGMTLADFAYALIGPPESGERIGAISATYAAWYPKEVWMKEQPTAGLDIYMAASCMAFLLGGDLPSGRLPDRAPRPLRAFLRGCALPDPRQRPQDAWALLPELDRLLEGMWGPRTFHPFAMPTKGA
jgi:serine/threonine protein kinase